MGLERKFQTLEKEAIPSGLPAALTGWSNPIDSEHPDLRTGPDENGHALISPYWAIWFLDGTKEEQEEELAQHRADPSYQNPPTESNLGKLFVRYINGASFDSVMYKIAKRRETRKISETKDAD